jgi:hypothetical protein
MGLSISLSTSRSVRCSHDPYSAFGHAPAGNSISQLGRQNKLEQRQRLPGGHYNPECLEANRVVKRWIHHTDFTVSGHIRAAPISPSPRTRLDLDRYRA